MKFDSIKENKQLRESNKRLVEENEKLKLFIRENICTQNLYYSDVYKGKQAWYLFYKGSKKLEIDSLLK